MPDNNRSPSQCSPERSSTFTAKPNVRRIAAPLTLLGVLILIMALSGCASPAGVQEDDPWQGHPGCLPRFE